MTRRSGPGEISKTGSRTRIIFDGSMARGGGGFTYAVNVIPLLARQMPSTDFLVLLRSRRIVESLPPLENLTVRLLPEAGFFERLRFLAITAPAIARSFRADIYYSASELSPLVPSCASIAAFRNANLFTEMRLGWPLTQRIRMKVLRALALYSARHCARILFVSRDSARWIGDLLDIPPSRRAVVPHGIHGDLWSRAAGPSPFERPFILTVSSIYRYKNYVRLIEAWTRLAERWSDVPDLVIVGDDQDSVHSREMQAARSRAGPHADRIHIVGEVPYSEIARYYRHAKAFVFPSYLETFGHPLLEAMAAGIPVIASDLGVFKEVGDEAVVYFPAHDTAAMEAAMERVLRDQSLQRELVNRGFDRVAAYSWVSTVDRMAEMFGEVLKAGSR